MAGNTPFRDNSSPYNQALTLEANVCKLSPYLHGAELSLIGGLYLPYRVILYKASRRKNIVYTDQTKVDPA